MSWTSEQVEALTAFSEYIDTYFPKYGKVLEFMAWTRMLNMMMFVYQSSRNPKRKEILSENLDRLNGILQAYQPSSLLRDEYSALEKLIEFVRDLNFSEYTKTYNTLLKQYADELATCPHPHYRTRRSAQAQLKDALNDVEKLDFSQKLNNALTEFQVQAVDSFLSQSDNKKYADHRSLLVKTDLPAWYYNKMAITAFICAVSAISLWSAGTVISCGLNNIPLGKPLMGGGLALLFLFAVSMVTYANYHTRQTRLIASVKTVDPIDLKIQVKALNDRMLSEPLGKLKTYLYSVAPVQLKPPVPPVPPIGHLLDKDQDPLLKNV